MTTFPGTLPKARTSDSRGAPSLRWGIMGTGWIAERLVASLQAHSSQHVVAVGSRNLDKAEQFAHRFSLERHHGSYRKLVEDPAVDVVYVATPHNVHVEGALLALAAGKHVLIEKPLATNADEARLIAAAATAANLFCMEAHWTTFLPKYDVLTQLLASGVVGELVGVVADFGEWFPSNHRIFRPELAGGPLLDLGTYLVSLAVNVLGTRPDEVVARSVSHISGVPGQIAMILSYGHRQAVLHTTVLANTPTTAAIAGTDATIVIDGPFYQPGGFSLTATDGRRLVYDEARSAHHGGLHYQAAEVARLISNGEKQSTLRPLDLSIQTLAVLDEVGRLTQDSPR